MAITVVTADELRGWQDDDDISMMSKAIYTDRDTTVELVEHANRSELAVIKQYQIEESEDGLRVSGIWPGDDKPLSLRQIGSGGAALMAADLASMKAHVLAERGPTLLVLDGIIGAIDKTGRSQILRHLANPAFTFQSVVMTADSVDVSDWVGWTVTRLRKGESGTKIEEVE